MNTLAPPMQDASFIEIGVAAGAAALTAWGVGRMRRWSVSRGLLDIPNERSSHDRPVPRGGGLIIVAVVLVGLLVAAWLSSGLWTGIAGGLGAALVAAVGWRDDIRSLSVGIRLLAQSAAAALVLISGFSTSWALPVVGDVRLGWSAPIFSFLVVVALTNAYNFMDGIDGIAGGQAVVAGAAWAVSGGLLGDPLAGWVGVLIGGAAAGFLVHNWPVARIFMGDVGSGTLGFLFAWLAVHGGVSDPRLPVAGLVFVWPFVFDTAFTFSRRLARGENVFHAHRSHLYQRLVISGLSHAQVSGAYGALALAGSGLAVAWLAGVPHAGTALVVFLPVAAALLITAVVTREKRVAKWIEAGGKDGSMPSSKSDDGSFSPSAATGAEAVPTARGRTESASGQGQKP